MVDTTETKEVLLGIADNLKELVVGTTQDVDFLYNALQEYDQDTHTDTLLTTFRLLVQAVQEAVTADPANMNTTLWVYDDIASIRQAINNTGEIVNQDETLTEIEKLYLGIDADAYLARFSNLLLEEVEFIPPDPLFGVCEPNDPGIMGGVVFGNMDSVAGAAE